MAKKPPPPAPKPRKPKRSICWPCTGGWHFACLGCDCPQH